MKHSRMMIATLGILLLAGARAEAQTTALYTGDIHGGGFHCNALNVSNTNLLVTISILSPDGSTIAAGKATTIAPGAVASTDSDDPLPNPTDGYCQVQVSGTNDASDLRVVMKVNLIRTFDQGRKKNIPVFLTWALLGN